MDKNALMQKLAREANEKGLFNGAWLFAENGELVSQGAVGWRDAADSLPVQPDSVFDLASVSKQFTATAILLLRREGLLSLEDDLTKFFPELPFEGVTVRHLLTHTSGLPDYMSWVDRTARAEHTIPPNSVVLRFLKESGEKALFAPGEKFEYCNTAYCVLAEIVAKLSGVPFEDFMRERVFEPAGMHATRVRHPRQNGADFDNYARAMVTIDGQFVLPEDTERYSFVVTLDGAVGDGCVYSSAPDLFAWDQALRAEKVLTKEEQELMLTPAKLNSGEPASEDGEACYGFGWYLFESPELGRVASHSGGWPGVSTWYGRYLDRNRVLVLLSCRDAVDGRGGDAFFRGMSAIGRGVEPKPLTCIEDLAVKDPDRSGWAAFCGKYETDPDDDSIEEIYLKDGELWAKIVSDMGCRYELRLYPIGDKAFGYKEYDTEIVFGENCFTVDGETVSKRT